ncbi:MAG TPA: NAD(P)-dependent oxidoreductase [Lacunisphaera sp.]|nr:NAD(P)-dependent oxidoreductase [Lacunisphaera sp.]
MLTHRNASPVPPGRVVILGANGFIPRALAARLRADQVAWVALGSAQLDLTAPGAGPRLGALLQPGDSVVMAAALTPDRGRDPATLMKNLRMAESVALALAAQPVAHLVYLSSDAVYDWRHPLVSEATPPTPTDLYSTMHLAREQVLGTAAAAARVPFCVLRPCAVYGPGDTHNGYGPNRFARSALADGKIRLFGGGEEMRDHVWIDDVAAVIALALAHGSTGHLNVVSGRSASFAEVAAQISALAPRSVTLEFLPRAGPVTHRHFDPTALLRAFPAHRPTALATGLPRLLGPA